METPKHISIKEFLVNSPAQDAKALLLLAHGAGKGMATPFMETIAKGLTAAGIRVVRFHFPYMEEMLRSGKKRPPNGGKKLRKCFSELITHCVEHEKVPSENILIAGKAMGARVASMIADEHKVAGLICFGYPFHPPRKPEKHRFQPLQVIKTPTLVCQGERDPHGNRDELRGIKLSKSIQVHWIKDGDGNFKPGRYSKRSLEDNMQDALETSTAFIEKRLR